MSDYQRVAIKDKTFISEMSRNNVPLEEIAQVMNERGEFCFETQIEQAPSVFGKRSAKTNILDVEEGKQKAEYYSNKPPATLDASQETFATRTLAIVDKNSHCETYTTGSNHPQADQILDQSQLKEICKNHMLDFVNYRSNFASISTAQMRCLYRAYKQAQLEDEQSLPVLKRSQHVQYMASPPDVFTSDYDVVGRDIHFKSILIGLVVWLLNFAAIFWLNSETKKEKER